MIFSSLQMRSRRSYCTAAVLLEATSTAVR